MNRIPGQPKQGTAYYRRTFYVDKQLFDATSKDADAGHLTAVMQRLASNYYLTKTPKEARLRKIADMEEQLARLQHDIQHERLEIEREDQAVQETRRELDLEREFRDRIRKASGADWKNWLHRERADVKTIGWKRAVEVFEAETGVRVTW